METILGRRLILALVIVAVAAVVTAQTEAQNLPCVAKLAGCADFYNNTSLTPSEECCGPLASALKTDIPCICAVFNDPALQKQLRINVQKGMELINRCKITGVDPNFCTSAPPASPPKNAPAVMAAPPSPSRSPFGAEWIGFSTFFSLLLFIMA